MAGKKEQHRSFVRKYRYQKTFLRRNDVNTNSWYHFRKVGQQSQGESFESKKRFFSQDATGWAERAGVLRR